MGIRRSRSGPRLTPVRRSINEAAGPRRGGGRGGAGGYPAAAARLPAAGYDLRVIVACSAGFTSDHAAAALQDLGVRGATDLAGGFLTWRQAGLPVTQELT